MFKIVQHKNENDCKEEKGMSSSSSKTQPTTTSVSNQNHHHSHPTEKNHRSGFANGRILSKQNRWNFPG